MQIPSDSGLLGYQSKRGRKKQLDDGIGNTFVEVFSFHVGRATGVDTKVWAIPSSNCLGTAFSGSMDGVAETYKLPTAPDGDSMVLPPRIKQCDRYARKSEMNASKCYLPISPLLSHEATAREEELVLAAKAGSDAAFGELQKKYSYRLYKHVLSITHNREDPEDVLQDTFLLAYRALHSFEGRSKLSTWLTRIAINSALAMLRKRRSRPETSYEQLDLEDSSPFVDVRDHALNLEELCEQKQRSREILHAILELEPNLRIPLYIQISQEHSINEIAQTLGISSASAKSRLFRARKQLIQSSALRNHRIEGCRRIEAH
jgi:RNA polymerase sigma-70 factor, ECF subfamily